MRDKHEKETAVGITLVLTICAGVIAYIVAATSIQHAENNIAYHCEHFKKVELNGEWYECYDVSTYETPQAYFDRGGH